MDDLQQWIEKYVQLCQQREDARTKCNKALTELQKKEAACRQIVQRLEREAAEHGITRKTLDSRVNAALNAVGLT